MVFLDTDGDGTAWGFGTVLFQFAGLAIFHRKLDLDDLVVVAIKRRRPTQAFTSSRARGFLCIPINVETSRSKALLLFGLPFVISSGGCDQIDPVLLATLHKLLGFGIIGVSQMLFSARLSKKRHGCKGSHNSSPNSMNNSSACCVRSMRLKRVGSIHVYKLPRYPSVGSGKRPPAGQCCWKGRWMWSLLKARTRCQESPCGITKQGSIPRWAALNCGRTSSR